MSQIPPRSQPGKMVLSDAVNFARNFAVMVRVRGPESFSFSLLKRLILYYHLSSLTQLAINFSGPKRVEDEKSRFSSIPVSNPTLNLILFFVSQSLVFLCTYGGGFWFSPSEYV